MNVRSPRQWLGGSAPSGRHGQLIKLERWRACATSGLLAIALLKYFTKTQVPRPCVFALTGSVSGEWPAVSSRHSEVFLAVVVVPHAH